MIKILSFAVLFSAMIGMKIYPRETLIISALVIMIVLLYPLIMNMSIDPLLNQCSCN